MRTLIISLPILFACIRPGATPDPESAPESVPDATPVASPDADPAPEDGGEAGPTLDLGSGPNPADLTPRAVTLEQCSDPDKDGFGVTNVRMEDGVLLATLRHGGGCEEHDFKVCWDGALTETETPMASIRIIHDANGDRCRALLTTALAVNLDVLQGQGVGAVLVGDQELPYSD